ncbi:hypothetical protein ACWEP8_37260 [Streptomyces hydrogenans]
MAQPTHQGPHPEYGGLETHYGTREDCSGPDCGPGSDECGYCGRPDPNFEHAETCEPVKPK